MHWRQALRGCPGRIGEIPQPVGFPVMETERYNALYVTWSLHMDRNVMIEDFPNTPIPRWFAD